MIAADTSRSKIYLQALIKFKLYPHYVLLLKNLSKVVLPGQNSVADDSHNIKIKLENDKNWLDWFFDQDTSLEFLLAENNIPYCVIDVTDINDKAIINNLEKRQESVFIYSGYGGSILKKEILKMKIFLHIHGGYLPKYRGSTTNYYSLLEDEKFSATAIFLNDEIDGGNILMRKFFELPKYPELIDHYYDSAARARVLISVLTDYVNTQEWNFEEIADEENKDLNVYYVIHPVIKHIAILGNKLK